MKTTHKETERQRKRVFLADQLSLVRLGVANLLTRTSDLEVCGQADGPENAMKSIERAKPDIIVTEIFGDDDCKFIQTLHKRHPRLPILVFSYGNERWYAPRVLEAGADGYMLKGVSADGLVDGIRRTLEGRVVLSPSVRYQLLVNCVRRKHCPGLTRKNGPPCSSSRTVER